MLYNVKIAGQTDGLYDAMNGLALLLMLVVWLSNAKQYRALALYPKLMSGRYRRPPFYGTERAFASYEMILIFAAFTAVSLAANSVTARMFHVGTANYFGNLFFGPLGVLLPCLLLRVDPFAVMDLMTPSVALCLGISKIGCFFSGCCYGFPCESFYYNRKNERTEFPIQLVEMGCALLIFAILLILQKKKKPDRHGTLFPIYIILYSVLRFFSEFARADWPRVAGRLTCYHLLCIAGVFVGALEWALVPRFGHLLTDWIDQLRSKSKLAFKKDKKHMRRG